MARSHDIEDVLSSIRRLVANDGTEAPQGTEAKPTKAEPTLVLAPAQRVTDPEDPFQMIRTLAQVERDGRDALHVLREVEKDVSSVTEDIVTEHAVDTLWSQPSNTPLDVPQDYAEDADFDQVESDDGQAKEEAPTSDVVMPFPAATSPDDHNDDDAGELSDVTDGIEGDDALRKLIAEIVRQELSGPLGERITRNVRKLVRRELRQMLSSGEFD